MNEQLTYGNFVTVFDAKLNCLAECQYLVKDQKYVQPGAGLFFRVTGFY